MKDVNQKKRIISIIKIENSNDRHVNINKRRKERLEETHPGYAYELLELQMSVEDSRVSP